MRIVPVIDLRGGRAVAGRSGERARYAPVMSRIRGGAAENLSDPRRLARALAETLASERLYVADLDRIEGTGDNGQVVTALLEDDPARVILWDGGLAVRADAPRHPRLVPILATECLAAVEEIDAAADGPGVAGAGAIGAPAGIASTGPPSPWLGLDLEARGLVARAPGVARLGEQALLQRAVRAAVGGVVIVLLSRVGTGSGLPRERLRRLRAGAAGLATIAGGGIASIDDLLFLRSIGCQGALLATALHDGRLRPADLRRAGLA
jgi:phosphoribosylformimino-5-aminoimidazole carboxamide ribotide isomerase